MEVGSSQFSPHCFVNFFFQMVAQKAQFSCLNSQVEFSLQISTCHCKSGMHPPSSEPGEHCAHYQCSFKKSHLENLQTPEPDPVSQLKERVSTSYVSLSLAQPLSWSAVQMSPAYLLLQFYKKGAQSTWQTCALERPNFII